MQEALTDLLAKRRDRVIAIILRVKEQECDQYLPNEAKAKLRKVVLDQLNEYHALAVDLIESTEGGVVNELYLERLDKIYDTVVALNGRASHD